MKTLFESRIWGLCVTLLLLAPVLFYVARGHGARWPFSAYTMYSRPATAERYAGFIRVAVGIDDGKPIWWKPDFEYRARFVARSLTQANSMPDGEAKKRQIVETLQYVDFYLSTLHPESPVDTFYLFRREIEPDWRIREELVSEIPRGALTP